MYRQIIFILSLCITLAVFSYTMHRLYRLFRITRAYKTGYYPKRFLMMLKVAIAQTKIFRFPFVGFLHALVFWGFILILFGSIEMIIDGISGSERSLSFLGVFYDYLIAAGDLFAFIIAVAIFIFLFRRIFIPVKRFRGEEMQHKSHLDANIALTMILLLMLSLLGMNAFYLSMHQESHAGLFPVSSKLLPYIDHWEPEQKHLWHEIHWWMHILLIFLFANILPYSKHFHVFTSVPNVFLSRLKPLGYLDNMPEITKEVTLMMHPEASFDTGAPEPGRFGVKDVCDIHWKNYFDALACTECGRCTSVCPASITGKRLSPRKIFIDLRARMKEAGLQYARLGKDFNDEKALVSTYISREELWACTTCNACAQECPVNIHHPSLIVDMRRYLVMEESAAPGEWNQMFSNIENNGAVWQFSPEDRMLWADNITMKKDV
jgi:heterodisulfide reductase subunit C/nitrate reductase gamma subunit